VIALTDQRPKNLERVRKMLASATSNQRDVARVAETDLIVLPNSIGA
jgi:hypothetical protein